MDFPSGDQSQPLTVKAPSVSRFGSRFPAVSRATGTTQRWFTVSFSPTTRASFLAFLSFSSWSLAGSVMAKAIRVPSGDQAKPPTPVLTSVSCSASPPSARMSQMLFFPDRPDVNAIHRPSGDQAGDEDLSPKVNWKLPEPSVAAIQSWVRNSLLSSVMTAEVTG